MTAGQRPDALVLAVDARSHGPRDVEVALRAVTDALGGRTPPTWASTHVVERDGVRHVGALVWEEPPVHLDLPAVAHRALPPGGATVIRMTRRSALQAAEQGDRTSAVVAAAAEAAGAARGRVVAFPGQDAVSGVVTVAELVATTAVDGVLGLAGTVVDGVDGVDTGGWLRPRWRDGALELLVERGAGGLLRPFEQQQQIACCAMH